MEQENILTPDGLADQIMRWDWRDMFREGHKQAITEMFEAYGDQVKKSEAKPDRSTFFRTDDELYAEHHRDESVRLQNVLIGRGFSSCGIGNAESLWMEYSDRWAAGFLGMPEDEDELYECVKDQLCVITSVPIG